jgi:hemerythrin-like domain-containing protein
MLAAFERLLTQLDQRGLDAQAQDSARIILDFFSGPGHQHHADEERHIFPLLVAAGDTEMIVHVRRLQQDHGWIEQDWLELSPHVEAIASGYNGYDLGLLRAALPIFTELYNEHIALEESLVYPAAMRHQQALDAGRQARNHPG